MSDKDDIVIRLQDEWAFEIIEHADADRAELEAINERFIKLIAARLYAIHEDK